MCNKTLSHRGRMTLLVAVTTTACSCGRWVLWMVATWQKKKKKQKYGKK